MRGITELKQLSRRLGLALTVVFILAITANAYTVVMRGGRQVEVPARFLLTSSTLTYEVSPGVQITIAVAAIDISATEKANGEAPGSFLKRVESSGSDNADVRSASGVRTITNRDLESAMRRRQESEQAYEIQAKAIGSAFDRGDSQTSRG